MTSLVQEIIIRIDKWDCMELKPFGTVEGIVESGDKHIDCEKIFASCTCDGGLIAN